MPPNEGQTTPAQQEGMRDMQKRAGIIERLRRRRGIDRADANRLKTFDTQYLQGRDNQSNPQGHVRRSIVESERGRITEFDSEFADRAVEQFGLEYAEADQKLQESRCGKGWRGAVCNFFENTNIGRGIKITAKLGVGALAVAGSLSSLGFATPFAVALARKYGVDGAGELIQQFWEVPAGRAVQACERAERNWLMAAMELRNWMQVQERQYYTNNNQKLVFRPDDQVTLAQDVKNDVTLNPRNHWYDVQRFQAQTISLQGQTIAERWREIEQGLDKASQQKQEAQMYLDRVRAWGKGIRGAVGTAIAVGSLAYNYAHGGISLGHHDFDAGQAKEIQASYNIPGYGQVRVGGHEVRFMDRGIHWLSSASHEYIKNGLTKTWDLIPGVSSGYHHTIGGGVGLWQSIGSIAAMGVGLGVTTYKDVVDTLRQRRLGRTRMAMPALTLRNRTLGQDIDFEFTSSAGMPMGAQENLVDNPDRIVREIKAQINQGSGTVWELSGPNQALVVVEIVGFETENGIETLFVNELDADGNSIPNRRHMSYAGNTRFINARKRGDNIEGYKEKLKEEREVAARQPMEQFEQWRNREGYEMPAKGQYWRGKRAGQSFNLTKQNNQAFTVAGDQRVRINRIVPDQPFAEINVISPAPQFQELSTEVITLQSLLESAKSAGGNRQEATQVSVELQFEEIKNLLRQDLKPNTTWRIGNEWYVVSAVDAEHGEITYLSDNINQQPPSGNQLKQQLLQNGKTMIFQDFITRLESARSGGETILKI